METPASPEITVAEWQEPAIQPPGLETSTRLAIIAGGAVLFIAFAFLGYRLKDFSYYIGSFAVLAAAFALLARKKEHTEAGRAISLTSEQLTVAGKSFPLAEIAGFWPEEDAGLVVINVEMKKPTFLPISFFFFSDDVDEARHTLTQVLPEVEPRQKELGDSINRFFRF